MILLIDNYDSFVFNLAHYIAELGFSYRVYRNDSLSLKDISKMDPSRIIISPGPCTPNEAGISMDLIKELGSSIPILGVCLGHQAIGQVFGGKIVKAKKPSHGKVCMVRHKKGGLFYNLPNPLKSGCYYSLAVQEEGLSEDLLVDAYSEEGEVMALRHARYPVYGVQFHPESILSDCGHALLENFLSV